MSHVAVVGAGIGGTALAAALREAGATVTVVADGAGASRCALALSRPTYLDPELRPCLDAVVERAETAAYGARVSHYRTPGREQFQPDWRAWDPVPLLAPPDVEGTVTAAGPRHVEVNGDRVAADAVVLATARPEWGRVTWGITWWHPEVTALTALDLRVHHLAPYKTLAGVVWPSGSRLGSSSAATPGKAVEQAERMFDVAVRLGWIANPDGWQALLGRRVQRNDWLRQGRNGVWSYGGFHRTGYVAAVAYAPQAAHDVLARTP